MVNIFNKSRCLPVELPDKQRLGGYSPAEAGSNNSGKNCPASTSPVGIPGIPFNISSLELDCVPSAKTLSTNALREFTERFSYEPCTISGWWNVPYPFFISI